MRAKHTEILHLNCKILVLTAQATQEAHPANVSAVCSTKGGRVYDQVLRDLWGILQL